MKTVWVFLDLGDGLQVAVPHTSLHRLLHRDDPDFDLYARQAVDLARLLGQILDPALPGVIAVLAGGTALLVGDATLQRPGDRLAYLSLDPELLAQSPPWCRGVLRGDGRWAFVLEEGAVA